VTDLPVYDGNNLKDLLFLFEEEMHKGSTPHQSGCQELRPLTTIWARCKPCLR
jgi:hypothetical protein